MPSLTVLRRRMLFRDRPPRSQLEMRGWCCSTSHWARIMLVILLMKEGWMWMISSCLCLWRSCSDLFLTHCMKGELGVSRAHRWPPLTLAFECVPVNFYNMVGSLSRKFKSSLSMLGVRLRQWEQRYGSHMFGYVGYDNIPSKGNPKSIFYLWRYIRIYLWQIKIHRWGEWWPSCIHLPFCRISHRRSQHQQVLSRAKSRSWAWPCRQWSYPGGIGYKPSHCTVQCRGISPVYKMLVIWRDGSRTNRYLFEQLSETQTNHSICSRSIRSTGIARSGEYC